MTYFKILGYILIILIMLFILFSSVYYIKPFKSIADCPFNKNNCKGNEFEWILEKKPSYSEVLLLLQELFKHQLDVIKTENLYMFDGLPAYSMGQGQ